VVTPCCWVKQGSADRPDAGSRRHELGTGLLLYPVLDLGAELAGKFGDSTAYVTDVPVSTQAQADAVAKAEMERIARQFCKGSCTVQGDDTIRAGSVVEFEGLPQGQNGKYYIIASRHVINQKSGYTTELTFCSNTTGT
jgi:phage protein D